MNKFSKSNSKNKRSLLSAALATVLAFSFNYSPISMISETIKNSVAYKSSTLQSYYGDATSTTESKIGAGDYPSALTEYFSKSSNNFNIGTYYDSRFADLFAGYVHDFLSSGKVASEDYEVKYQQFLTAKGANTLLEYYNADSTYINTTYSVANFKSFVEYFVSHEITWTISDSTTGKLPAVYTQDPIRSHFYCALTNFLLGPDAITDPNNAVGDGANGNKDNLPNEYTEAEFYKHSVQYNRLKDYIDAVIVKTVAIYSYDGVTQQNTMAGILADGAPISSTYYYQDNSYISQNTPNINYTNKTVTSGGTSTTKRAIYYFGTNFNELTSAPNYSTCSAYINTASQDTLISNVLQYRLIKNGEFGYISDAYPTYYKYESIPFATTNEKYDLYVVDDNVTATEKATYDSMFIKVITSQDIADDQANAVRLGTEFNTPEVDAKFYFKIPYSAAETNGDVYFDKIVNYNFTEKTYERFCEIFGESSSHKGLYLKYRTNTNYIVYYDPSINSKTLEEFKDANSSYSYILKEFNLASKNEKDYFEVTTSFSSYYKLNYKLYFEKIKVNYTEIDIENSYSDPVQYVTKKSPISPFETSTNTIPTETYEMTANGKKIYALVDDTYTSETITLNSNILPVVEQFEFDHTNNRNFFVEVPESTYKKIYGESAERTNKLYFKHNAQYAKQIFVIDDDAKASENEVYKNLYYTVLTTANYKLNSSDYVKIETTDANYNANFTLYYKYDEDKNFKDIFVQNELRNTSTDPDQNASAVYIIDDSLTYSDKTAYALNLYTVITTDEFNANKEYYVQITSDDQNYSTMYTKLYYKYIENTSASAEQRVIYTYTSGKSDKYQTFYKNNTDYVASDYELIQAGDPNYVDGIDLYYKKIRTERTKDIVQDTYYSFSTTSSITLKANGYYAISFYVNTTGNYYNEGGVTLPVEASFYLKDANGYIKDIALEKISTAGKWVKYYMFIATDLSASSSVTLSMYMGNKDTILGSAKKTAADNSYTINTVTGSVLFDNVQVTTINLTDFTKRFVDDKDISVEKHTFNDQETEIAVKIANDLSEFNTTNTFDNRAFTTVAIGDNNNSTNWDNTTPALTWADMFDFDSAKVAEELGKIPAVDSDTDAYTLNDAMWSYYISRDVSGIGNTLKLQQYQEAYIAGNLTATIVDETTKVSKDIVPVEEEDEDKKEEDKKEEDKKEEDKKEEDKDNVLSIKSTFNEDNKVLELKNTNKIISLGISSNAFTIEQFRYYKITVWVFAPHKEATASVTLNSVVETASTPTYGSLQSKTITLDACYAAESYKSAPTNEYGWIPVSMYVEGNALHDQLCYLVLSAGKNSTVYFDNITIEEISSSIYDTASSDSDNTTNCLALTPTTAVVSNGITNGYFNNITFKTDYKNPDMTAPREAKNWTIDANSSSAAVAGIVSTSKQYSTLSGNFFAKYNNSTVPYSAGFNVDNSYNNVFAIYAPSTKDNPIDGSTQTGVATRNNYKIYSSAISLSANTTYEIAFSFYKGEGFSGNMVSNLYYGSVDSAKVISSFKMSASNIGSGWQTFTYYIKTAQATASVYLEFGIDSAVGTCFFKDAYSKTTTKTLEELRDNVINSSENVSGSASDLSNKLSLQTYKFIDFSALSSSTHGNTLNADRNTYDVTEYTSSLVSKKDFTVGKSGVAVATFYEELDPTVVYSVKISEATYYIGAIDGETPDEKVYKLYSCKCLCEDNEVKEIAGSPVTVVDYKTVKVGADLESATEHTSTKTETSNYKYTFENDVTINNVIIPASELTNNYSDSVMILANSYSTDYILASPTYTTTLAKTSYYLLKVYVKTSDFADEDTGLNINVNSIATSWNNINTTALAAEKADENGFVCYQIAIKTGNSTVASFGITFSIGTEKATCKGYAIIADVQIQSFAAEADLDHYVSTVEDDETTVKKYYANATSSTASDDAKEDEDKANWATFFYVFSSLLLGLVLAMALVAVFVKKHPIKHKVIATNEHEKDLDVLQVKKPSAIDTAEPTTSKKNDKTSSDGEGIV